MSLLFLPLRLREGASAEVYHRSREATSQDSFRSNERHKCRACALSDAKVMKKVEAQKEKANYFEENSQKVVFLCSDKHKWLARSCGEVQPVTISGKIEPSRWFKRRIRLFSAEKLDVWNKRPIFAVSWTKVVS